MVTKAQRAAMEADVAAQRSKRGNKSATKPAAKPEQPKPKRSYVRRNVQAHVEKVQPEVEHADFETMFGIELPSAGRVLVGVVLALASSFTVGYGIGMIMSYALAGVATLTGSALVAFMLSAIIWLLGIYATWKIGGYVGGKVFASVVLPDGLASRSYEALANGASNIKQGVVGWFSAKPSVAQFNGAFTKAA